MRSGRSGNGGGRRHHMHAAAHEPDQDEQAQGDRDWPSMPSAHLKCDS